MPDFDLIRNGRHYDALKAQNDIPFYLTHAQGAAGAGAANEDRN